MAFDTEVFNYTLDADFFNKVEQTEVRRSDVNVALTVTRHTEDTFSLTFDCTGTVVIGCDRCLDDLVHHVDTVYEIGVRLQGNEYDDSHDEVLLIPESWRELDVAPLMRDTVLLTIPMTHVHADGECNDEMTALLTDHAVEGLDEASPCSTTPEANAGNEDNECADPRWEALRKLLDNN